MATDKDEIIIFMIEELTKLVRQGSKAPQIDFLKIDTLSDQLEQTGASVRESITKIEEAAQYIQQPVRTEHRHTFDIRSNYAFVSLILLGLISACLAYALITERQEAATMRDNDLKYRYVKMKGEASSQRISELENLFEINRDNPKIKQLRNDVEEYERAIKEKTTLDEQNRLRQLETEKLNDKAETIKMKQ